MSERFRNVWWFVTVVVGGHFVAFLFDRTVKTDKI